MAAFEIGEGVEESVEESAVKLLSLAKQHQSEWANFMRSLGPASWLVKLAEAS
jgi:hypothetical protein